VSPEGFESVAGADVGALPEIAAESGITIVPLFGPSEERVRRQVETLEATTASEVPDLSVYYRVFAPDERLDELAESLREEDAVEAAYVKPPSEPPQINEMTAAPEAAPPATPDFTASQIYLNAAPAGIDAHYAATVSGGRGHDVQIIDIEGAWRFTHEDLTQNQGGLAGGSMSTDLGWRNHGTAVIGEFGGDDNGFGITGICPEADTRAISIFGGMGSAGAIRKAADLLRPGDIILLELHRPGPRHGFASRNDQRGYIAIEWWPDDFDAILYATAKGVIVVEAAGNGAENLDDALYDTPAPGFPAGWTNPFDRSNRDSGAIVVGAGAPPPGTHGRDHGPDRSRLDFSNFGALIDAQGWGREVTTAGYGNLQGGGSEDLWYTDTFSGTSSASPIVVGALGCAQGVLRKSGATPMTPAQARRCLRSTGSAQQDAPGRPSTQRIGNRPDLRRLIDCAGGVKRKDIKEKEIKEFKERDFKVKDLKELKEFKEKDFKDFKEKEGKEIKEIKEKDRKEIKEKDIFEKFRDFDDFFFRTPDAGDLESRVARLEGTVAEMSHFISPEMRPDLTPGATEDRDREARELSDRLRREAEEAKARKEQKDTEKSRETW
jgi:hypothetical protein